MIKLIKRIINHFELKKVRKELEMLNDKYISVVNVDWEQKGYTDRVTCFEKNIINFNHECNTTFIKGIDLVIANNNVEKNIFLISVSPNLESLIKKYLKLQGLPCTGVYTQLKD